MNNPSPQSLSKLQKKVSSLSVQVGGYHEQLDRLRESVAALTDEVDSLTRTVADKKQALDAMNASYREKQISWLNTLTSMQAQADILRTRIARLEGQEILVNERTAAKVKEMTKHVNDFLSLD